jgi:hypothetical protein
MRKLLLFFLSVSVVIWAQSYTASVRGIVTDPTQALVPLASVTITDVERNLRYNATTDEAGRYMLTALPPGRYTLTVEASGFQTHTQPAFRLEVQQQATINVELVLSGVTTTIEVTEATPLLNTTIATLGQVVENKLILSTPLLARNPMALTMLTPGLVPSNNSPGGVLNTNFVANGVRNSTADAMLDGVVITGVEQNGGVTHMKYTPSVEAVQEFKIQTNFFNAEFGNTGGAVINMVSKSGTNELHGVAYEFHRNAALNANSFFSNRAGRTLPEFKRNVYGGTMGGPVWIPKVYDGRDKTFFFFLYEGTRQESASTTLGTVPTAQQIAGDFSDTRLSNGNLVPIYNPFDTYTAADGRILRRPFENNMIPPSMHSTVARNVLAFYPAPTSEGAPFTRVNNFFAQGVGKSESEKLDSKIDHNLSEKQRLMSRYSVDWGSSKPANLLGNVADSWNPGSSRSQSFVFDFTRSHNPTTLFTARVGILRVKADSVPGSNRANFDVRTLGLPEIMRTGGTYQFPNFAPSGYRTLGAGGWSLIHRAEDIVPVNASATKVAGAHTIKGGVEFRRLRLNYTQPGFPAGGFNFNRAQTGVNPLVASSSQGDAIASMLLGWGNGGYMWIDTPAATAAQYFGVYTQDDWRITRKLTLNLGMRYDFDLPRTERFNRLHWYDYDAPSPIAGQVPAFPDLKGVMRFVDEDNRSPFAGDYNNLQPRFGLAYALGNKTSIRAAYGIFYSVARHTIKGEVGPAFRSSSSVDWSRDSHYTRFASLDNPYPLGLTEPFGRDPLAFLGFGFSVYGRDSKNPQYQQWNFSVQREAPGDGVVEVNYAGSKGTYLYFGSGDVLGNHNKLDPMYYGIGRTALNAQVPNPFYGVITDPRSILSLPTTQFHRFLRPYPQHAGGMGGYLDPPNIGNSNYHSVQFKYERRFSKGLAVLAHYTVSKMISDSDTSASDVDWLLTTTGVQNWKDLSLERSLAVFDIPQRAVVTFNYELPVGRGKTFGSGMNRVADAVAGGWEVSGILTFSSGFPLIPSLANPSLWEGAQRPNLIGDPSTSGSPSQRIDQYFNASAFSQPAADIYGTAPRTLSSYRAFGIRNADMTLMKNFAIKEGKSLQFRLESYNLTNTPTFGVPDSSFGSSSFGVISGYASGRGARETQVAVKFYY